MIKLTNRCGAAALFVTAFAVVPSHAESVGPNDLGRAEPAATSSSIDPAATTARSAGRATGRRAAGLAHQTYAVMTSCFPATLRSVLSDISSRFGGEVIVTSGYRRSGKRGSFHQTCKAADIQIAGISPGAIARFARSHPSVGGVGTYSHTRSVHVDVGDRVYTWNHGRRGRTARLGNGCCPDCAAAEARASGRHFEAVCAG